MKGIIMAGGFGSRLRPLTDTIPKPMMPIINKPILEYIVELLCNHGITEIAMTLGYKPEKIMDYFGCGDKWGVEITYFIEDEPLGTAGGVKSTGDFVEDSAVIISGDAFTNINLTDLIDYHRQKGGILTMATKYIEEVSNFGVVKYDNDGQILAFIEKPKKSMEHMVNTGIYVVDRELMAYIPEGRYDFAKDLFPMVMSRLRAYPMKEYWSDIGTLSSYYLTNNDVAIGAVAMLS